MFTTLSNLPAASLSLLATIAGLSLVILAQFLLLRRRTNTFVQASREHDETIRDRDELLEIAKDAVALVEKVNATLGEVERDAMEARADADDAQDELRAAAGRKQPQAPKLADLLDMIGQNGQSTLDTIFGPGGFRRVRTRATFPGYTPDGEVFTSTCDPNEPPFSFEDLRKAIEGDTSDIERAIGAIPGSTILEVLDMNGRIVTGAERDAVLKQYARNRPGFTEPAHFGPAGGTESEACDTQRAPYRPGNAVDGDPYQKAAESFRAAGVQGGDRRVPRFENRDEGQGEGSGGIERPGFHGGARSGPLGFHG